MRIALVNMPFARIEFPSLALTQLKARLEQAFGTQIEVEVHYLNHDFAAFLGVEPNQALTLMSMNNGIGEWFFRQAAFPDQPDNAIEYLQRSFPKRDAEARSFRQMVLDKRQKLAAFLHDIIARHALDRTDVLGFTSMFSQNVASIALARLVKQSNPAIVTVVGGANCEYPMGPVLARNIDCMDYVFSGPALKSFPAFIGRLLADDRAACDAIPGVFSRSNADRAATLAPIGEELPIDTPIPLDYDGFMAAYRSSFGETHYRPSLLFETSRGCWWGEKAHCTFCGLNGLTMAYRAMSPELAVAQIQRLFAYAPQCAQLQSVDNILPKSYLSEVLPRLATPASTSLFYEVKSDLSDADFEVLAKARVKFIQPGVEALATSTLKLMKKGSTAFQNIALLKNCALHDIDPAWNLLVGFPGEPAAVYEKYVQDLPLMAHLPAPLCVASVRFDRYSPYFTKAKDYGLELKPFDFYRMTYPFSDEELADLAYYFYDDNVHATYIADLAGWIEPLRRIVATWREGWLQPELRPALHLDHSGPTPLLVEARGGVRTETPLSPTRLCILDLLQQPRSEAALRSELPDVDVAAELGWMRERRLLFAEHDRMLSLVLPRPAAAAERRNDIRNPAAVA